MYLPCRADTTSHSQNKLYENMEFASSPVRSTHPIKSYHNIAPRAPDIQKYKPSEDVNFRPSALSMSYRPGTISTSSFSYTSPIQNKPYSDVNNHSWLPQAVTQKPITGTYQRSGHRPGIYTSNIQGSVVPNIIKGQPTTTHYNQSNLDRQIYSKQTPDPSKYLSSRVSQPNVQFARTVQPGIQRQSHNIVKAPETSEVSSKAPCVINGSISINTVPKAVVSSYSYFPGPVTVTNPAPSTWFSLGNSTPQTQNIDWTPYNSIPGNEAIKSDNTDLKKNYFASSLDKNDFNTTNQLNSTIPDTSSKQPSLQSVEATFATIPLSSNLTGNTENSKTQKSSLVSLPCYTTVKPEHVSHLQATLTNNMVQQHKLSNIQGSETLNLPDKVVVDKVGVDASTSTELDLNQGKTIDLNVSFVPSSNIGETTTNIGAQISSNNAEISETQTKDEKASKPEETEPVVLKGYFGEYVLGTRLQNCIYGAVYVAHEKDSQVEWAVKVIDQDIVNIGKEIDSCEENPYSEVEFQNFMRRSEHTMAMLEHIILGSHTYIISPLARGGDVLELLKDISNGSGTGITEEHAAHIIEQVVMGLYALHSQNIALHDISLENILLSIKPDGTFRAQLCDPGQAGYFTSITKKSFRGIYGSFPDTEVRNAVTQHSANRFEYECMIKWKGELGKIFRPPEMYVPEYYFASKVDSWCLGWCVFYVITGMMPFCKVDPEEARWQLVESGDIEKLLEVTGCRFLSYEARDFIFRLMDIHPQRRMTMTEALFHPWLQKKSPLYASAELYQREKKNATALQKHSIEKGFHILGLTDISDIDWEAGTKHYDSVVKTE